MHHVKLTGGSHRKVYHGSLAEGPTVGYLHHDFLAVAFVLYQQCGSERQCAVCAGQRIAVIDFTGTCTATVPAIAVISGIALLDTVAVVVGKNVDICHNENGKEHKCQRFHLRTESELPGCLA